MFTGLVEDIGTVLRADRKSDALELVIEPSTFDTTELALGDSVAVSGVCLTVTDRRPGQFTVLCGAETLRRTALKAVRSRTQVNLERALRVGDRLGGHMMQGHVDGVGHIASCRDLGANLEISVRPPRPLLRYVVEKGSIGIDGISLTVNTVSSATFAVALIPHTVDKTTLSGKKPGDPVNLEVDIIGKYVEKLLAGHLNEAPGAAKEPSS